MTAPRGLRRAAAVAVVALAAGLLPAAVVGGASPVAAAEDCLSEEPPNALQAGCDDTTPPDTTVTMSPAPNAAGWVSTESVTFTFSGTPSPGDSTELSYECRLDDPATTTAEAWASCTSPVTAEVDNATNAYTFEVRAIDTADQAEACCVPFLGTSQEQVQDKDATPATLSFKVDTERPQTYVFGLPRDELRPKLPMITSRTLGLSLAASEADATFRCSLDGTAVPCQAGTTTLKGLTPGDKTFRARAVDAAGNADESATLVRFAVPRNLTTKARGWTGYRSSGYFNNDYAEAKRPGAEAVVRVRDVKEIRLIAAKGPGAGKIKVQLGDSRWRVVNLAAASFTPQVVIPLRDEFGPLVTGVIRIRTLSSKPVRLDAILAH